MATDTRLSGARETPETFGGTDEARGAPPCAAHSPPVPDSPLAPESGLRRRATSERAPTHSAVPRWLDGRALLVVLALEVLATLVLLVPRGEIAAVSAGLGEYAASLSSGRGYALRVPCDQLDHARRLPFAPFFLAAVASLGGGVWGAVLARLTFSLALLVSVVARFAREGGRRWWRSRAWGLLFGLLAAAPLYAKHLAQLGYEEGFSLSLVPGALLAGMAVVEPPRHATPRGGWGLLLGALLAAVFLLKSGYGAFFLAGCGALLWASLRHRDGNAWLGLAVALAAPLAWAAYVFHATGRLSLGSSWDGENLFRGWSSAGLEVYPWRSLDRLFDAPEIPVRGAVVSAPFAPPRCAFAGEWAWSDHYRERAIAWAAAAPASAARFLLEKLGVVLLEVRPVPLAGLSDAVRTWVVIPSFVLLRGAVALALVLAVKHRRALTARRPQLVFAAAALVGLCLPLLAGFAYDRHTFVLLVAVLFAAAALGSRLEATD